MHHKIVTLDLHQSIQLLMNKAGRDTLGSEEAKHAGWIVEALQHLPLAIAQAGAAIRENEMKFTEYLDKLKENPKDLLSKRPRQGGDSYEYTTNTTWEVSLSMMAEKRPAELVDAQSILNALGYFYHGGVPIIILEHFLKDESRDRSETIKTTWHFFASLLFNSVSTIKSSNLDTGDRVMQALRLLSRYSLIEKDNARDEVSVHGLVHSWIRSRMYKSDQTKAQKQALSALGARVGNGNSITDYELRRKVYPHIRSFIECVDRQTLPCPFIGSEQTMKDFARVTFESGNFQLSQRLYQGYFHHLETKLGTQDARTLTIMHELSRVYERQGLYEEAKNWAESAFTLGEDGTTALASKARLAVALAGKGDYEGSRQANEFVLDSLGRITGDEKQLLEVEVKKNLAYVLQRQGKYEEAAQLAKEALLATKNLLGEDHPETLEVLSNLALIMEKLDKWEDAECLTKEAWRKKEKYLGKDHPETITSRARLGVILTEQGHYSDAEEILRETLELTKCILGKEHPDTLTSLSQLGEVLFRQGNYEKAEKKLRKALQGFRDHMDQDHDNIRMSEINLGVCLRRQKKYDESEKLHRQSLARYDLKFGTEHPDTMKARDSFVAVLLAQHKRAEAEEVAQDLVAHSERRFGRSGAETLKRIDSLGWIKVALGKELGEAEALIREAVEGLADKLGEASPNTLTATYHLAYVFRRRQKYDDSWLTYQRACQGMRAQGLKGDECFEGFEKLKREMEQKGIKRGIDEEEGLPPTKRQKL
ncbi:Purine-cytosine permease fcy21 [Hypoxylon texense]